MSQLLGDTDGELAPRLGAGRPLTEIPRKELNATAGALTASEVALRSAVTGGGGSAQVLRDPIELGGGNDGGTGGPDTGTGGDAGGGFGPSSGGYATE